MISETISHYRIISKLGAGGMGEVYLAEDIRLRRKVALKILADDLTQNEDRLGRFKQEAQTASALNHPNILTIYEVEEHNGLHFIATEFIEGETLRERAKRDRMDAAEVVEMALQVAGALSAAHAAGIIHRDIKPENIMLRPDGYIKVLDFGLAKLTQAHSHSTETFAETVTRVETGSGIVMGTVPYMSPEQARGQPLDVRSDIFSLGVVIYELLAGTQPFQGETTADLFVSILTTEPSPLSYSFTGIAPELERIVLKCLQKDREQRYASIDDLVLDLKMIGSPVSGEYIAAKRSTSIAVLPFVNMSADPENEYFCDGLAEELLNSLAKIDALHVAARTSSFSFKGKQTDIGEIGRKLRVATVLEGSVRKAGNRLRITAQLINVADGYHLWSERYDREMQDIFDVQDEISLAIVDALKVKLLGAEKAAVLKRYTDNTEAYHLYLRGRYHDGKYREEEFWKAIECFEQAIAIEPNYAPAFAGLALAYLRLWWFGCLSPAEGEAKWQAAAAKAASLDSDLAEGHLVQANISFFQKWDFPRAEMEWKRRYFGRLIPGFGADPRLMVFEAK